VLVSGAEAKILRGFDARAEEAAEKGRIGAANERPEGQERSFSASSEARTYLRSKGNGKFKSNGTLHRQSWSSFLDMFLELAIDL